MEGARREAEELGRPTTQPGLEPGPWLQRLALSTGMPAPQGVPAWTQHTEG